MPVPGARLFFSQMLLRDGCVLIGVPGLAVGVRGQIFVTVTVMVTVCAATLPCLSLHAATLHSARMRKSKRRRSAEAGEPHKLNQLISVGIGTSANPSSDHLSICSSAHQHGHFRTTRHPHTGTARALYTHIHIAQLMEVNCSRASLREEEVGVRHTALARRRRKQYELDHTI